MFKWNFLAGIIFAIILFVGFLELKPTNVPILKTPTITPTATPTPYIFSERKLWDLISDWQLSKGWQPYIESQKLCEFADIRLDETDTEWSHNGFWDHVNKKTVPFRYVDLAENLARGWNTEEETLQKWLESPKHKKNLTNYYKYSCLRCRSNRCVQEFANF